MTDQNLTPAELWQPKLLSIVETKLSKDERFYSLWSPTDVERTYKAARDDNGLMVIPKFIIGKGEVWMRFHHTEFRNVQDYH